MIKLKLAAWTSTIIQCLLLLSAVLLTISLVAADDEEGVFLEKIEGLLDLEAPVEIEPRDASPTELPALIPLSVGYLKVAALGLPQVTENNWSESISPADASQFFSDDFSGDGKTDIAEFSNFTGTWTVHVSDGQRFRASSWGSLPAPSNQWSHYSGDFNADGRKDIASFSSNTRAWTVSLGQQDRFLSTPFPLIQGSTAYSNASAWGHLIFDSNGDGFDDILSYNVTAQAWQHLLSTGNGFALALHKPSVPPQETSSYFVGDFNGDGLDDIAEYLSASGDWTVHLTRSDLPLLSQVWSAEADLPAAEFTHLVADVNGDGKDDIASIEAGSGTWYVKLSLGDHFESSVWFEGVAARYDATHVVGNFTSDNKNDVVSYSFGTGRWNLLSSDGTKFTESILADEKTNPDNLAYFVGDYDGNGIHDLAWFKSDIAAPMALPDDTVDINPRSSAAFVATAQPQAPGSFPMVCGPVHRTESDLQAQFSEPTIAGQRLLIKATIDADIDGPPTDAYVIVGGRRYRVSEFPKFEHTAVGTSTQIKYRIDLGWDPGDRIEITVCKERLSNLLAIAPRFNADGSVTFGYRVEALGGSLKFGTITTILHESKLAGNIDIISEPLGVCTGSASVGDHLCKVSKEKLRSATTDSTHLLTYIPKQAPESNTGDNKARLPLSNLTILAPEIFSDGNVSFGYDVLAAQGPQLPLKATYYYAKGPNEADILPGAPLHEFNVPANSTSPGRKSRRFSELGRKPDDAKYIIAIVDKDKLLRESNDTDNIKFLKLPDLSIRKFEWAKSGDLRVTVNVVGKPPTGAGIPVALYAGKKDGTIFENKPVRLLTTPVFKEGDTALRFRAADVKRAFGNGGVEDRTLYARVNYLNSVLEANPLNNTSELVGGYTPTQVAPSSLSVRYADWVGVESDDAWAMRVDFTADDGLRIAGLRFQSKLISRSMTIPYFVISLNVAKSTGGYEDLRVRGQLKNDGDELTMRSRLVKILRRRVDEDSNGIINIKDPYLFQADYVVDRFTPSSKSQLFVTQKYRFYAADEDASVAPFSPLDHHVIDPLLGKHAPVRFFPEVSYQFVGVGGETMNFISVPQRLDFQLQNNPVNTAAFFFDLDYFNIPPTIAYPANPLLVESRVNAINQGNAGVVDNMHVSIHPEVDTPYVSSACHDCVHMHWRWAAWLDYPAGSLGRPVIPADSGQSVDVGFVRRKKGEEDPTAWQDLVQNESVLEKDLVFWYNGRASSDSDTFFSHGAFIKKPPHNHDEHEHEAQAPDGDIVESRERSFSIQRGETIVLPVLDAEEDIDTSGFTLSILQDDYQSLQWQQGVLSYTARSGAPAKDVVRYRLFDNEEGAFRHYVVTVNVGTAPPSNLRATPGNGNVRLIWNDNSSDEAQYVVESSRDGQPWAFQENVPANPVNGALIENLRTNTKYYFRVRAERADGSRSEPSNVVEVELILEAPTNLRFSQSGASAARLLWNDNSSNENNYVIEKSSNGTSWSDQENVPANPTNGALIQGLSLNTTYYYRVRAVAVDGGRSAPSNVIAVSLTLNAPSSLRITERNASSLRILWNDNSAHEDHFIVERSANQTNWVDQERVPANPVNGAFIQGLSLGSTFYFRVRAVAGGGERSEASNVVDFTTANPPPPPPPPPPPLTAPSSLRISETGLNSARLLWNDNTSHESHFVVERSQNGSDWVLQENVPANPINGALIEGLSRNITYYFRVSAAIASGERSAASNVVSVFLQASVSAAPDGLSLAQNGTTSIRITWRDNSPDESHFVVQQSRDSANWQDKENVPANPVNGALITGLAAQTTYYYRIFAVNIDGRRSAPSNVLQVQTLSDSIAAPTNLQSSELTRTSVRLKWRDNSADESSFVVQSSRDNASWSDRENVPANPINGAKIDNLAANTTYYFRVRAAGTGSKRSEPSNVVSIKTLK